jgi:hypothetical protein
MIRLLATLTSALQSHLHQGLGDAVALFMLAGCEQSYVTKLVKGIERSDRQASNWQNPERSTGSGRCRENLALT